MELLYPSFKDIQKAILLDSTPAKYYVLLSEIYFKQNDPVRAIKSLRKAELQEPKNTDILLALCKYYFYLQEYNNALAYADKVLQLNKHLSEAYFLKGLIYKDLGKAEEAISHFQTAVEKNPEHYEAYMQLGLLTEKQDKTIASAYYDNALRLDSNSSEARYAKALLLQQQNETEKAKQVYRELINKDPQFEKALYNLGYIYFQQDSLEKAKRHFEMALGVNPVYADAMYMLGLCEEAKKNHARALYFYNQTLNLDSQHELALEGIKRIKGVN